MATNGTTHTDSSDPKVDLQRYDTAGSIMMPKEIFEKLYLNPENRVSGHLRKTLGNPTPLGLAGFLLALTPIAIDFMGWRGAGGDGAATIGATYFLGGLLAILSAIGEFLLGNSFSMILFGVYGGFFLAYGATLQPSFNAYIAYDPMNPAEAVMAPGFLASIGFLTLFMALFTLMMVVCSIRTNVIFFLVFITLDFGFIFVTVSDWYGAQGNLENFKYYRLVSGGFLFATIAMGWYYLFALMLGVIDFPIQLPVGDLSQVIKGYSEKHAPKRAEDMA